MDQAQLEATARKGIDALNRGDAGAAHAAFQAIIDIGRATPQLWALMAQACERLGDMVTLTQALDQMLAADLRDILALAMKGDLFLKAGDDPRTEIERRLIGRARCSGFTEDAAIDMKQQGRLVIRGAAEHDAIDARKFALGLIGNAIGFVVGFGGYLLTDWLVGDDVEESIRNLAGEQGCTGGIGPGK